MGKNIFWVVLTVLIIGCSGGSGGSDDHEDEDGRSSATPVANHNSVAPGTCNTCHNGTTAEGKDSGHISTTASCDTCHRTTAWEPATMSHSSAAPGTCATCHNGATAEGKDSGHVSTTASCDTCHLTTDWKPATTPSHSSAAPGTCATCHNGTTAEGKGSGHVSTSASCDTCHLTTGWIPAAATASHSSAAPGTCATCHNGTAASGKHLTHISTSDSCDTCHQMAGWIPATMVTSTIDFPVEAVFSTLASTASTFNASATDAAGNSLSMSVEHRPGSDKIDTLIYPELLKTYTQSNTLRKNGNITSVKNLEEFYSTVPLYWFGNLNNIYGSSNTMKVTTQLPLPSTSRVGASGVVYRGRNYINNSTTSFDAWYVTWSLEADSTTTAWLCLNIAITPASGSAGSTSENNCFRIDQAGGISGFKADTIENGVALSYR